jgi:hypothetical protein
MKNKKELKDLKKTHYSIPKWKISALKEIGRAYDLPFEDAPFDGSYEEGYFEIDKARKTKLWKNFLKEIISLAVHYEYAFKSGEGKKIYMPIQIWEKKELK